MLKVEYPVLDAISRHVPLSPSRRDAELLEASIKCAVIGLLRAILTKD